MRRRLFGYIFGSKPPEGPSVRYYNGQMLVPDAAMCSLVMWVGKNLGERCLSEPGRTVYALLRAGF